MDPFTTFGLALRYDIDLIELDRRYRELQQALHPDKHGASSASERSMTLRKAIEVNEAYRVLRDDSKRAEALLAAVSGGAPAAPDEKPDPELLMEMMELRESLSEARAQGAAERVGKLAHEVTTKAAEVRKGLLDAFTRFAATRSDAELRALRTLIGRLRYYRRFLDEVAVFEDEALG
jgi:molecular chaperone HscB